MKNYLLDTSVIIDYINNKAGMVEYIDGLEGNKNSTYFTAAELYEGIHNAPEKKKQIVKEKVDIFLTGLTTMYNLDTETAHEFARVRSELRNSRQLIEDIDIFIAATALTYNNVLVTLNSKHFERIPGLEVLDPSKNDRGMN